MNIAIDITSLKQRDLSGVGNYLKEVLSRLLVLDKENNYYLISYGRKNKDLSINLPKSQKIHYIHYNISSKLVLLSGLTRITNFFCNWPKIDKLKINNESINIDIIWLPNFNICNFKNNKIKLITTIHDLSFKKYPQFLNFKKKIWHYSVKPKKVIKKSNILLAVSENTSLDLQNIYKVSKDKIIVSLLGIDKRFRIINDEELLNNVKSKYNLPEKFILFVGIKEPRKNILGLLQAFKEIKFNGLELVIVGGQGWKEKLWKRFYNNLDNSIKSRIKILDYFPEKDLPALYNLARIFVWPSFYEGFGLPPLEALACKCPVITANNSSLPEVFKDNALLIESFNVENLYQAMDSLLKDEELYNFYKNKKVPEEYYLNWNKAAEKILNIYKKIV